MNAVLSKLEAYTTEEDANFIQSKLSPQMRDAVLQKKLSRGFLKRFGTIEEYRSMQRSVFALMTTKTYNLDLCVLMSYHPRPDNDPNFLKDFIKILEMLSISAPNVRQLQMRSLDLCRFFANDEVRKVCLDYLGSLKELRILEIIGSVCKNAVLPLLCRELPSLQVLSAPEIPLLDTYMTEEDIRGSFGHLRLLHIEHLSIYKKYQIWQVLPYLNIIRNDQRNSSLTFEDFLEDENIPRERKYLNFDDHLMKLNDCTDYTSIKFLEFSCETSWEEMKKILKRTTTLEGLTLKIMKNGAPFDDVLRECGAKLGYLSLTGDHYSSVELNSISQLCPRLKVLSIASVQVTAETFQQVNFSHLEELFTEDLDLWMDGSFTAILTSSPNLRKLEINRDTCSLEEMQQIKYLIIEKKILGSLQLKNRYVKYRTQNGGRYSFKENQTPVERFKEAEGLGGGSYVQKILSPEQREYVLQNLLRRGTRKCNTIEEFTDMKRSVLVLMNTRTKKLDLNVLMSSYPSNLNSIFDFMEVLKMMSIDAPNVRHLKINTHHISICLDSIELRNACFGSLNSTMELRIFELVGYFDDDLDLALICRELPNLRVLSAPRIKSEVYKMSEEDIRLSFGHLRMLHIQYLPWTRVDNLWEVLPNLDIVEFNLPNGLTLEDFLEDENLPRKRKYLKVENHPRKLSVSADLSSIRYLEFSCHVSTWVEMEKTLKLPEKINGLILSSMLLNSQETVKAILLKYGTNLRWLSLRGSGGYQSVQLNRISELCPNLEVLSMISLRVTGNSTRQANFHHLEELFTEDVDMMNGSLTAIFSASPNLQKLQLKEILGSLQSLHCGIAWNTTVPLFKEIAALMKIASANLPELRKMKLFFDQISSSIDILRSIWFKDRSFELPNDNGLYTAINADANLFEILKIYE
ncbi:Hypothetical predicted protein [Cloeon dipterum]|uniref:F-box/LRR-repeat protein 15/At3g58940/PEG3-like LRR domain-containing protein n=1 Tax=Cloeon dipterum TaxID=197152 RepID=A0A8S1E340_9INSE|nr:Hypothetical predicted protein [Cloeon dipterum]